MSGSQGYMCRLMINPVPRLSILMEAWEASKGKR